MNLVERTSWVKNLLLSNDFDFCGFAKAQQLDEDARRLENWLNKGMNGHMEYMANYFDKRIDPTKLMPGAKTVITLLKNYYPETQQDLTDPDIPKISKYAYGKDYHEVIRADLKRILLLMEEKIGHIEGRGFVDSAPVMERAWAQKSGLGWQGKNGMIIHKGAGSFFFIATLIVDFEVIYDSPMAKDFCGSCTKCIDACPTEAILPNKVVDGSKCISYYTIELKEKLIDPNVSQRFDNWMFGCDTCQDVCPWNRFSVTHQEDNFQPINEILHFTKKDWEELTEDNFKEIFRKSPLKRTKFAGIKANLKLIS